MAKLEVPALALKIDSIYHADEDYTEFIVTKREEEAQMLLKALQKRKEIKYMERR